jgi:hypothetical protein
MAKHCVLLITVLFLMAFLSPSVSFVSFAQTPTPVRDLAGCIPKPGEIRFNGARPESAILNDVPLLTQPRFGNDAHPLTLVTIPKNARVVVFDIDNVEKRWYRVLWACDDFAYAGWVPKDTVRFFDRNANPKVAPPACVNSVTTLETLDVAWKSTIQAKRMVVVVDLFRAPDKTRYQSFFYLTRNGKDVKDKDREIQTEGPFLLNGEVINTSIAPGTVVGFDLTRPNPSIRIFATVYQVPEGCQWDV